MSGFYLLALIAIWLLVGWGIYRIWRRWRPPDLGRKILHIAIGVLLFSLWFGGAFWEVAGKKMYWDARVRELCAKDGGIKVYEKVELPAEMFDKYGNIGLKSKRSASPTEKYFYESDQTIIRMRDPKIIRSTTQIIRRSDGKILGKSIRYGRSGGDLPGPWTSSTFSCPPLKEAPGKLENSIFIKGGEK